MAASNHLVFEKILSNLCGSSFGQETVKELFFCSCEGWKVVMSQRSSESEECTNHFMEEVIAKLSESLHECENQTSVPSHIIIHKHNDMVLFPAKKCTKSLTFGYLLVNHCI